MESKLLKSYAIFNVQDYSYKKTFKSIQSNRYLYTAKLSVQLISPFALPSNAGEALRSAWL